MRLVKVEKSRVFELVATRIADRLIVAGQGLHARYAVLPAHQGADDAFIRAEGWRSGLAAFVTFAAPLEFSRAQVLGAGICSRPAYDTYMGLLRKMGVIVTWAKSGSGWAYGWDRRKFLALMRRRLIEAPYPVDLDAPRLLHTRGLESQSSQPSQRAQVVWNRTVKP